MSYRICSEYIYILINHRKTQSSRALYIQKARDFLLVHGNNVMDAL